MQRSGGEAVPGCVGDLSENRDYCIGSSLSEWSMTYRSGGGDTQDPALWTPGVGLNEGAGVGLNVGASSKLDNKMSIVSESSEKCSGGVSRNITSRKSQIKRANGGVTYADVVRTKL